jgi:glycyl-tRNA synthetase beta subunit
VKRESTSSQVSRVYAGALGLSLSLFLQAKLGSMLAKSEREEAVLPALTAAAGLEGEALATAQAAAPMAKADLATAVVTEFTSLAGVIGRHYAEMEGHPQPVRHAFSAKDENSMKVR